MKLSIYSLKGVVYEEEIKSVNLMTVSGEITVMENHRPLVSILKKGQIKIVDHHDQFQKVIVLGGFIEVNTKNSVHILANL